MTTLFDTLPDPKMKPDGTIERRGRPRKPDCTLCGQSKTCRKDTLELIIDLAESKKVHAERKSSYDLERNYTLSSLQADLKNLLN